MRGQIRGLDQASTNAQDGISLIQTAEGALSETHSILQRMRELAVQAANDTNVSVDRNSIKAELESLTDEISRIADQTEFNTKTLIDGTYSSTAMNFQVGANASQNISLNIKNMSASALGVQKTNVADKVDTYTHATAVITTINDAISKGIAGKIFSWCCSEQIGAYDCECG